MYGGIMFGVGIIFSALLLTGYIKIPQIFATSSWNQTDWSSGVGASTTNQYASGSNVNYSTNGEITFTGTAGWYNGTWLRRKKITFNNTTANIGTTSEVLTNYPVLIKLTNSNFDFTKAKSDGSDVRFTDSDGATLLNYEIEKWDSVNLLASIWVKVPQIDIESTTDNIYMYFGNSGASDAQNKTGVWDSNFVGVYHLKEDPSGASPQILDSTTYANNGSTVGAMTSGDIVNGQLGTALDFDGNDAIVVPNHASLSGMNYLTQEAWVYMRSFAGGPVVMGKNNSYDLYMNGGSGTLYTDYKSASGGSVPQNTWAQIVMTYNGTNPKLYINGALVVTGGATSGAITISSTPFEIGRWASVTEYVNGLIDESRVSTVARSAAWLAVSYKQGMGSFNTYLTTENYYQTTGSLTSNIFDASTGHDWGIVSYAATTPSGTSVSVKVRSSNASDMTGAPAFASCTAIASGALASTGGCVTNNHRYVQYEVTLSGDGSTTPTFSDITINMTPSDTTPPTSNASFLTLKTSPTGTTITASTYTQSGTPYLSFTAGADNGGGSGLKGY
jgi:hypothetical protein